MKGFASIVANAALLSLFWLSVAAAPATAQSIAPVLADGGLDQRLGAQVPLDLQLQDESGHAVRLGDLLGGKPVVLSLVQFRCSMLCGELLGGLLKSSQ